MCNLICRIVIVWLLASLAVVRADSESDAVSSAYLVSGLYDGEEETSLDLKILSTLVNDLIENVRQADVVIEDLERIDKILRAIQEKIRVRLGKLEMATNDNEAALENMYRSQLWADLNFSEVIFIYARAWTNLFIARKTKDQVNRGKSLRLAHKGFRVASTQFFRPDLMYGAWAGVGYAEAEMGRFTRAREIFNRLYKVMDETKNSKAKRALESELRVLDALTNNVKNENFAAKVDEDEAKILRFELLSLLRKSKEDGIFPEGASERLNNLVSAGRMDQTLFEQVMTYPLEVSSLNVGQWAELASAEYRLQTGDFSRAVRKFNAFFNRGNIPTGLNLTRYRYRWAVAAYKSEYYQTCTDILENLLRNRDLPNDTVKKSSKLLYLAYLALDSKKSSLSNRKFLRKAAKRFIDTNPKDVGIDVAKLVLAKTGSNYSESIGLLENLLEEGFNRAEVLRAIFEVRARKFEKKIRLGEMKESRHFAEEGLSDYEKMSEFDRNNLLYKALKIQMRAVAEENVEEVILEIKDIEKQDTFDREVERSLFWTHLLLVGRGDHGDATIYFDKLIEQGIPHWKMDIVYRFLSSLKSSELTVKFAERLILLPSLESNMTKRIRIIWIEGLIDLRRSKQSYEEATRFLNDYPTSGDAWRLLGRSAEAEGLLFEADKAWGMVTKKTSPRQRVWWEGMINRTRIRSTRRPDQACMLLKRLILSERSLPKDYLIKYRRIKSGLDCSFSKQSPNT